MSELLNYSLRFGLAVMFVGVKGISHHELGSTNTGRQVSGWRCASACFSAWITGHWPTCQDLSKERVYRTLCTSVDLSKAAEEGDDDNPKSAT